MSKKENKFREYDISTQAVHTGTDYDEGTGAVRRPLHMAKKYPLSTPQMMTVGTVNEKKSLFVV